MARLGIVTLLLAACTAGGDKADGGADSGADSGGDSGSDSGSDSGADSGGDSGGDSGSGETTTFGLTVTTELSGALAYELATVIPGTPSTVGASTVHGAIVSGAASFEVPAPTADAAELDADRHPGLYGVAAVLAVHEDDGDGVHGAGEAYVGVAPGALWFLVDPLPTADADAGFVAGWNHVLPSEDGASDTPGDVAAIAMATSFVPRETLTLTAKTVGVDAGARLALVPYTVFNGGSVATLLHDDVISAPLTLTLSGAPPADHFTEPQPGLHAAGELPLPYLDSDGSGGWTDADAKAGVTCIGPDELALYWYDPPEDLATLWTLASLGTRPGWNALAITEGRLIPVPEDAYGSAAVVQTCVAY